MHKLTALAALLAAALPAGAQNLDITRPEVQRFISTVSSRNDIPAESLAATLGAAVPQKSILELMARPAEKTMTWSDYRARFLTAERITAGLALWQQQDAVLTRISSQTGVPPEYLLAITGVETFYGRIMGRQRVLDALTTLAFDYPPRSEYFSRELEQYLLLVREEKLDPAAPMGSYAGAMGAPQFMPTSLRRFAVDGDGDGHRDLWNDWADVFASIANYFTAHGWEPGQPVMSETTQDSVSDDPAAAKLALDDTVAGLRGRGYVFETTLDPSTRVMAVPAPQPDAMAWRVGFHNFYVITRYNRSALYGMAVHDLAQALREGRSAQGTPAG